MTYIYETIRFAILWTLLSLPAKHPAKHPAKYPAKHPDKQVALFIDIKTNIYLVFCGCFLLYL